METLPFIDAHEQLIAAPREAVYAALAAKVQRTPILNGRAFPERTPAPPDKLALAGRHRFARYSLHFELCSDGEGTRVRAVTHADFPSRAGNVYRALVIGSGGHALIVKRFLRQLRATVEKRA